MKNLSVALCMGLCLAFGLARCGAGTDVCSKAANANLLTKVGTCSFVDATTDAGFTLDVDPGLRTACQQAISACSDPDKTALTSMLDCLGNVAPCVAGSEKAFESSVLGCTFLAAGLGQPCLNSLTTAADGGH